MNKKILVIGATGFVGSAVAKQLQADGFTVRAFIRKEEKARQLLGDKVEIIVGNFTDKATLDMALAGVDAVNLSAPWQAEAQLARDVTDILAKQGRRDVRVSYISGITVLPENSGYVMIDEKLKAEEILKQSGVAYTIFRPNWFMDALALFVRDRRATIFGSQKQAYAFLCLADFARSVSLAHQLESAANQTFVLNGPQPMRMEEALQQYCAIVHPGVKVTTMPIWFGKFLAYLTKSDQMNTFVQMMAYFEKSPKISPPNGAEDMLKVALTPFQEWLKIQEESIGKL